MVKDAKMDLERACKGVKTVRSATIATQLRNEAIRNAWLEIQTASGSVKKFMSDLSGFDNVSEFEDLEIGITLYHNHKITVIICHIQIFYFYFLAANDKATILNYKSNIIDSDDENDLDMESDIEESEVFRHKYKTSYIN